jgi:hypothetical protein
MWASMQLNITWTTKAKLFSFYEAPATAKIQGNTENWTPTSSQLQELAVRSHTRMLPFWSPDISSVWNWTHSSAHSLQVNPSSMDCICAHFSINYLLQRSDYIQLTPIYYFTDMVAEINSTTARKVTTQILCHICPNQSKHNQNECSHNLVSITHKVWFIKTFYQNN